MKLDVHGQGDGRILDVDGKGGWGILKIGQFSWTPYADHPYYSFVTSPRLMRRDTDEGFMLNPIELRKYQLKTREQKRIPKPKMHWQSGKEKATTKLRTICFSKR